MRRIVGMVLGLMVGLSTVPAVLAASGVDTLSLRHQRCLATVSEQPVLLDITYRGNLVTGAGLSVFDVTATLADAQDEGLLGDAAPFTPAEQYSPPGVIGKLRSRLGSSFMSRLVGRHAKALGAVDKMGGGTKAELVTAPDEDPSYVPVTGGDPGMALAPDFARRGTDGMIVGHLLRDTDGDGLPNLFDARPFFGEKWDEEGDAQDQAREQVEDKVKEDLKQRLTDQATQPDQAWRRELKVPDSSGLDRASLGKSAARKTLLGKLGAFGALPVGFLLYRALENASDGGSGRQLDRIIVGPTFN